METSSESAPRRITRKRLLDLARECWNQADGDVEKARMAFEDRAKSLGMDPATIAMILIVAVRFWLWLKENGVLEADESSGGEPWFYSLEGVPIDE